MANELKLKVWGLIRLTKKQILIFEMSFLTVFILLTVFLFSYEFPTHLNSDAFNFHAKYAKYFSLACTFLIIVETQFLWMKFTKLQLRKIEQQKKKIEQQKAHIEKQNKNLKDSIKYASKIQSALLPSRSKMERLLENHFLYFEPRDIVSGDFYWIDELDGKTIIAVADCTGHGVPGAFVSVLGISFLNDIIQRTEIDKTDLSPAMILDRLRKKMRGALTKSETEEKTYDGMDIAVCIIDKKNKVLEFSGAVHPIIIVRSGEKKGKTIERIRTDVQSISMISSKAHSYNTQTVKIAKSDMIYMFSDGYIDQFGGNAGKKFMTKNFKELLLKIANEPLDKQREMLEKRINRWKGDFKQVDDMLVLGFRV